jgi:hypothetical protein
MEKFQNKYRTASARAKWWDYGSNASYFVTICTQNRVHYFGEIENQTMQLSEIGRCAVTCWQEIPNHFPFVELGAFVVMPNHVHGIIIIDKPTTVETQNIASLPFPAAHNKLGPETQNIASLPFPAAHNKLGLEAQNFSSPSDNRTRNGKISK